MRIRLFSLLSLRLAIRNCSVIVRLLCRWLLFQMNPVVVLLLALNGARVIGFPMDSGAEWRPKDSSPAPTSSLTLLHPRTRSLPHFPLATGNDHPATAEDDERGSDRVKHGSSLSASTVDIESVSLGDVGIDLLFGFLEQQWKKRGGEPALSPASESAVSTTTQPATVDIKTLPGYWLKDPSRAEPPSWHVVDYRTERYRLDDLLRFKDNDGSKSI